MEKTSRERFQSDPAQFLEERIKDYVHHGPLNRLRALGGTPIFDEPLVGFADGDDPIFVQYKTIMGDFHLTPREALARHVAGELGEGSPEWPAVSAVAWVLPIARETRLSNRRESEGPSLRWNHTRWQGQDFNFDLARYVVSLLEDLGYRAVAPESAPSFRILRLPDGFASSWSQRHIAYAAGLGTFSLSDGFITRKGIAMRCGSVVTDVELPASPRPYPNYLANCLFYVDRSCHRCIERCPGGAITEEGHDKVKCRAIMFEQQKAWVEGAHGEGYIGDYAGCGLCQTKVPCEDRIPPVLGKKR